MEYFHETHNEESSFVAASDEEAMEKAKNIKNLMILWRKEPNGPFEYYTVWDIHDGFPL